MRRSMIILTVLGVVCAKLPNLKKEDRFLESAGSWKFNLFGAHSVDDKKPTEEPLWALSIRDDLDSARLRIGTSEEEREFDDIVGPMIKRFEEQHAGDSTYERHKQITSSRKPLHFKQHEQPSFKNKKRLEKIFNGTTEKFLLSSERPEALYIDTSVKPINESNSHVSNISDTSETPTEVKEFKNNLNVSSITNVWQKAVEDIISKLIEIYSFSHKDSDKKSINQKKYDKAEANASSSLVYVSSEKQTTLEMSKKPFDEHSNQRLGEYRKVTKKPKMNKDDMFSSQAPAKKFKYPKKTSMHSFKNSQPTEPNEHPPSNKTAVSVEPHGLSSERPSDIREIKKDILKAVNKMFMRVDEADVHAEPSITVYFKRNFTSMLVESHNKYLYYVIKPPSPFPSWFYQSHATEAQHDTGAGDVAIPNQIMEEFYVALLRKLNLIITSSTFPLSK